MEVLNLCLSLKRISNIGCISGIKINGFVFRYRGIYNIFVDENITFKKKKETILHELAHIELSQLEQVDNDLLAFKTDKYEDDADRYVKFLINIYEEE